MNKYAPLMQTYVQLQASQTKTLDMLLPIFY